MHLLIGGPVYQFEIGKTICVDYKGDPTIGGSEPRTLTLWVESQRSIMQQWNCRVIAPGGWKVTPEVSTIMLSNGMARPRRTAVNLTVEIETPQAVNRAVVELTSPGFPTTMTVPVILVAK